MDLTVLLSRIQFAMSVGFHFLFPVTTLGLTFYIVLVEGFYLKTGQELYRKISTFAVKILAFIFALGVATGLLMPFAFGTNWGRFVDYVGAVFGVHLTIETLVAFTMETVFLGVLLFGRSKVSKGAYFAAAFLVFLGSHLSGFFIIAANSWLQTPFHSAETLASGVPIAAIDGFAIENGRIVMTDVGKVIFNPSTLVRFAHTVAACWLCGAVFMGASAGWHLLKNRDNQPARKAFSIAVVIGLVTAILMPVLGHEHIVIANEWQPVKMAAMEGVYNTQTHATLYGFAVTNPETQRTSGIGFPGMLSMLDGFSFDTEVRGLNEFPKAEWPPVNIIFQSFRVMVFAGVIMLVVLALAALFLIRSRKTHADAPDWLLHACFWILPLPYLAVEFGWMSAEIGRQPWIVFHLQKTADAASVLPAGYVVFSLVILVLVYTALAVLAFRFIPRIVREELK